MEFVESTALPNQAFFAIKFEDGTEMDLGPGDTFVIEPGHDAWVLGDERFVSFEFESRSAEQDARQ